MEHLQIWNLFGSNFGLGAAATAGRSLRWGPWGSSVVVGRWRTRVGRLCGWGSWGPSGPSSRIRVSLLGFFSLVVEQSGQGGGGEMRE